MPAQCRADFESKQEGCLKALLVMALALERMPFLAGDNYTIADISLYAYAHITMAQSQ